MNNDCIVSHGSIYVNVLFWDTSRDDDHLSSCDFAETSRHDVLTPRVSYVPQIVQRLGELCLMAGRSTNPSTVSQGKVKFNHVMILTYPR